MAKSSFGLATGILASVSAMAVALAGVPAGATPAASAGKSAQQPTGDRVTAIATKIRAELAGLKSDASSEDMEAAIVFALGQADDSLDDMNAALDVINAGASPALQTAVKNVRLALAKKKLKPGTGATGSNGNNNGSGFTSPVVNVGGGTSNYTQ